jgi:1-acyl-sn-glycerol-3-phosphate acyltransferase
VLRRRWPWLFALFRRYTRSYLRRHFNAVRLCREGADITDLGGPLVVVLNHPSWWDPLVGLLLTERFPGRTHFAPVEAAALGRYRFFERLGFFGVRSGTAGGAREFLRTGVLLLQRPGTALWVTAQGRFTDPRQRPPGLRPGVGHLARRLRGATLLPLALEYPFWEERLPEALARFGRPVVVEDGSARPAAAWVKVIEERLAEAQDALAEAARARDRAAFEVLLRGRAGVGGVYDGWRRLRAWLTGRRFHAEHGEG